jgi:hypothetical protein
MVAQGLGFRVSTLKKIPEKNTVGHQVLLGYNVPYTWVSDLVLKSPK